MKKNPLIERSEKERRKEREVYLKERKTGRR